jgi:hypothetical protein
VVVLSKDAMSIDTIVLFITAKVRKKNHITIDIIEKISIRCIYKESKPSSQTAYFSRKMINID